MEKLLNTPELRFPEFEGEWDYKTLGELSQNISSGKSVTNNDSGLYPLYGSTGKIGYVNKFDFSIESILIARVGANAGFNYKVSNKYAVTDNTLILTLTESVNIDFIYYYLSKINLNRLVFGSGQPLITGSLLKKTLILVPITLSEQQKIAQFLSSVDEKIQALKKKKSLLEQYKKGMMQKIFSQELRFKDENGKEFPEWESNNLGKITFKVDKKNKLNEDLPVYSISNKNGFVHQSEQFDGVDSVERGYNTSLYKIVESNTFAYNPARINVGSIGYSGSLERVLVSSLYVCFKTSETVVDSFFNYYLQTFHFHKSVLRNSEGGVRDYLFYENFSQITISIPSVDEQLKVSSFLNSLDEKIEHIGNQLAKMEQWKKGLLQKMFV